MTYNNPMGPELTSDINHLIDAKRMRQEDYERMADNRGVREALIP